MKEITEQEFNRCLVRIIGNTGGLRRKVVFLKKLLLAIEEQEEAKDILTPIQDTMTNELTIEERIRLVEPEAREAVFIIPHPPKVTETILDAYLIPRTREYLNYLTYTTEGVLTNKDAIGGYLTDCIKRFEGAYTPFKESITFDYGFRPLSEEEFLSKGEEFVHDKRWTK